MRWYFKTQIMEKGWVEKDVGEKYARLREQV